VRIPASGANDAALLHLSGSFVDEEQLLAGHDRDFHHQESAGGADVQDGIFLKEGTKFGLVTVDANAGRDGLAFACAPLDRRLAGVFFPLLAFGF
jgi:hypothetical protein